jgi:integrase/recombinase XerD
MFAEQRVTNSSAIGQLASEFLLFAEVELSFSKETIVKYRDCLRQVQKILGDFVVTDFSKSELMTVKAALLARNLSVNRQIGILLVLKRFYRYLKEERSLAVLDPEEIRPPRRPRKEVAYLTAEEVQRFVSIIKISNHRGYSYVAGLRFRALVETILGSAMRISEVLSLNRNQIDFKRAQATIIGKGRKERTVFFTERALFWIQRYLDTRADTCPALFVCQDGRARLKRTDVWRPFTKYRKLSGIEKKVTPHLLRHTAATQLLFNGCPVGHIKEILGHERLETTCRYYLGLDHRAAQAAHRKYLTYSAPAA